MEILRKILHKYHGISVYEIKELAVNGFQYRYQILNDSGAPLTEKYSSLDYVMKIYQRYIEPDIEKFLIVEPLGKEIIKR